MKTMVPFLFAVGACATDAPPIDPATCDAPRSYKIDGVELPPTSALARERALDLNDDGVLDNQLGQVSGFLTTEFSEVPLELSSQANVHLATDTSWQIRIADCPGNQRLVAIDREDAELALEGRQVDGVVEAAGFAGGVPLIAMFDGTGTVLPQRGRSFATSERTAVRVTETAGELTGTVGFAIDARVAPALVIHAIAPFLVEQDDPFDMDANGDGVLTEAEIASNSAARAVLAGDISIRDVEATSFAVSIHATRM